MERSVLAVCLLTRGYKDLSHYEKLIKRNKCLEKFNNHLYNVDFIIFHEGNINIDHQKYISEQTPSIKFRFVDVSKDFKNDKKIEFYPPTKNFGLGYRNMCSFWFVGFWKYVCRYSKIIRIDEDCYIDFYFNDIFAKLDSKICVYGKYVFDSPKVTEGLNEFTQKFFERRGKIVETKKPAGPYTNLIGLNLRLLRRNVVLEDYIKEINLSNNIYIYRWGDLPLWGEVLHYLYKDEDHLECKEIKYYHGSHKRDVNN